MASQKVSLSLDKAAWTFAEQAAARTGQSPSTWISRAVRREAVRAGAGTCPGGHELALADENERHRAEEAMRAAG